MTINLTPRKCLAYRSCRGSCRSWGTSNQVCLMRCASRESTLSPPQPPRRVRAAGPARRRTVRVDHLRRRHRQCPAPAGDAAGGRARGDPREAPLAAVVWSDETTARINGRPHWHWVLSPPRRCARDRPRRARAVAEAVMGGHKPAVWIRPLRRPAGDGRRTSGLLAHVLRDVRYAIDCGDAVFAPALARLLAWTIAVGRRRDEPRDSTLRQYRTKVDCRLDRLLATPAPHPAGRTLQAQVKAWRTEFFIFLEDRRVSATNNVAAREIRPSVVFRKVTGGFRSQWGPGVHAGYRSATSTARIAGQTAFDTIRGIADTLFRPVAQTA